MGGAGELPRNVCADPDRSIRSRHDRAPREQRSPGSRCEHVARVIRERREWHRTSGRRTRAGRVRRDETLGTTPCFDSKLGIDESMDDVLQGVRTTRRDEQRGDPQHGKRPGASKNSESGSGSVHVLRIARIEADACPAIPPRGVLCPRTPGKRKPGSGATQRLMCARLAQRLLRPLSTSRDDRRRTNEYP